MNTRSLSFRLVTWYAGVLTGVFLFLCSVMYFDLRHFLESNLLESQMRRARQIGDTLLSRVGQTGEAYVVAQIKERYDPELNGRFVRLSRAGGGVLYKSGVPKDLSFDPSQLLPLVTSPRKEFSQKLRLPDGKQLLVAALNFQSPEGQHYLIEVGAPLDPVKGMLDHLFLQFALGLPVAVLVAVGGGYLLVRRALMPVNRIAHRAERITQNNLSERLPETHTGDELERLSISLNHMIDRLEDAIQNSKRFVADASHELRTPLTILRGELEQLTQDKRLDADTVETLGSMLEEVERLAKIVEGLLALSRLDAGEAQAEWVLFDLGELATTTADQMNLLAEDRGISVHCKAEPQVIVEGDQARLKQVIVNLLDNAIKYTLDGGSIHLQVSRQNGQAILEVADNGIGIPAEAVAHVFERFFRVDKSRTRDPGGAGLGLSVVKSICAAHGAEVQLESVPGKGSRFSVRLPLIKAEFHERKKYENALRN